MENGPFFLIWEGGEENFCRFVVKVKRSFLHLKSSLQTWARLLGMAARAISTCYMVLPSHDNPLC